MAARTGRPLDRGDQLDRDAVAAIAGIKVDTLDTYLRDGRAPAPDGYISRSPWWWESGVRAWAASRKTTPGREPKRTAAKVSA